MTIPKIMFSRFCLCPSLSLLLGDHRSATARAASCLAAVQMVALNPNCARLLQRMLIALLRYLTCQGLAQPIIKEIHGGKTPEEAIQLHQQRFNRRNQLALMREVTAKMGSVFTMDTLFDPDYKFDDMFPVWPQTATAMANSFHGVSAWGWSVSDFSSPVTLCK